MNNLRSALSIIAIMLVSLTYGGIAVVARDSSISLTMNGAGWLEMGQFVKFYNKGVERQHQWISRSFLDLGMDASIDERIRIGVGLEGKMWLNIPKGGGTGQALYLHRLNSTFIVDRAYGSYLWGDTGAPFLSVSFGRFPYKYNPEVRNLGEYLFRSGTYPAYLINNFDLPYARLTGFKISSDLFEKFHQDLLLTFETDIPPYYDASLSYIADYNVGKFLDIGAGVEFARLFSVDESQTTPKVSYRDRYVTTPGDTGYYTFRGTKLMTRFCLSPIDFFRTLLNAPLDFFGKEDCKIYAEAAVLGLESYPKNDSLTSTISTHNNIWGYDSLLNKIPRTFGFNIPTFKLLDVLSLEFEYYRCPYANNYYNELGVGPGQSLPIPDFSTYIDYSADNWKWSVYAKKMFAHNHFGIIAQFARDHIRTETIVDEGAEIEEALRTNAQWWWAAKVLAQF
jgi:hypothetical protein